MEGSAVKKGLDDPWRVLGVPRNASLAEVRRAFRRKARLLHPDGQGPGSMEGFMELRWAYQEILRRLQEGRPAVLRGWREFMDGAYLFVDVEAHKAFRGGTVEVSLADQEEFCPRCQGSGRVKDRCERVCSHCGGTGHVAIRWGDEQLRVICTRCGGTGATGRPPCPLCKGMGRISRTRRVEVRLPRGIKSGTVLRLSGQGPWRPHRQSRDPLYVEVRVSMPPGFSLLGLDVLALHEVPIWTALSGGTISVPTMDGEVECWIPPGTQQGELIRIRGRGWIDEAGNRGDHIVRLQVALPQGPPPPGAARLIAALRELWPAGPPRRALPPGSGGGG